jgi:hypothetical protein
MTRNLLTVAGIAVAVAVVYHRVLGAYFFEDDFQWLAGTLTYDPAGLLSLSGRTHFYRPVIELYFWVATPLFGGSAALFHLANLLLHAANGWLLFLLARHIRAGVRFAFSVALFFVVMPGYVEAVAWVGALAEPIGAFFGLSSLNAFLVYRQTGGRLCRAASIVTFAFALLTHESSGVFLPLLVLADWVAGDRHKALIPRSSGAWLAGVRLYGPYLLVVALYLVPDLSINEQSYIVAEGYYRLGPHMLTNALNYVVSLYVGKKSLASYLMIALALTWIVIRGSRPGRFAVAWMVLGMLPFLPFTWGNASRYLYLPSMGFAILLAEGIEWIDRACARYPLRLRLPAVGLLIAAVAIRFSVFAFEGVINFSERTEVYRRFSEDVREMHPQLAPYSTVFIEARDEKRLHYRYLEALIRWEFRDPTIRVAVRPR